MKHITSWIFGAGSLASIFAVALLYLLSTPIITHAQTSINGQEITDATRWDKTGSPYKISGTLKIDKAGSLEIEPDVEVHFATQESGIIVEGVLKVFGTQNHPVTFTRAASLRPNHWQHIQFNPGSFGLLQHCVIEYAGHGDRPALDIQTSDVVVQRCDIRHNRSSGIRVSNKAKPHLFGNRFTQLSGYGLINDSPSVSVDARHNWWGHPSGPSHPSKNNHGRGVPVSDGVLFEPWLLNPDAAATAAPKVPMFCGLLFCLVYLIAVIVIRWNYIAVPTRRLAQAHLQGLRRRWKAETLRGASDGANKDSPIEQLLDEAECELKPCSLLEGIQDSFFGSASTKNKSEARASWTTCLFDFLFWPRGTELKAWRIVHDAERLVTLGMKKSLVQERLKQVLKDSPTRELTHLEPAQGTTQSQATPSTTTGESSSYSEEVEQLKSTLDKVEQILNKKSSGEKQKLTQDERKDCVDLLGKLKQSVQNLKDKSQSLENFLKELPELSENSLLDEGTLASLKKSLERLKQWLEQELKDQSSKDVRAQLYQALRRYYNETDTHFAMLSTAHAKISWLIYLGLGFIVAFLAIQSALESRLPITREIGFWMLFGAFGSLLGRLLHKMKSSELPTDYGFYWVLLFLAPIYGALAGIALLLVLALAVSLKILDANTFAFVTSESADGFLARLALAAIAGSSAQLLDRLLRNVEEKVAPTQSKQTPSTNQQSSESEPAQSTATTA